MQNRLRGNSIELHRISALALALSALLAGSLYYVLFRQHSPLAGAVSVPLASGWLPWAQAGTAIAWLPSFTHAFASLLCLHALLKGHKKSRWIWRAVIVSLFFTVELTLGIVDSLDILAIVSGIALAEVIAWKLRLYEVSGATEQQRPIEAVCRGANKLVGCSVVTVSALLAAGSYPAAYYNECAFFDNGGFCSEYKRSAAPVYMSYKELRESVRVEAARAPDQLGRVYLYQNYVFLNERNQGIHIIDNSEPTSPVNLGFIRIPGNTEIAIRDNYLYADSYVDLITLDLNDPSRIQEINRQEDIFPYDGLQNIPYNVSLSRADIDPLRGVIVSYQLTEY